MATYNGPGGTMGSATDSSRGDREHIIVWQAYSVYIQYLII